MKVKATIDDHLKALQKQPVAIAMDSSSMAVRGYSGGVIKSGCGQNLDHAVNLVGYGTSDDGTDYWIVRNSWGANWGENGYFRVKRSNENLCGLLSWASYPIV